MLSDEKQQIRRQCRLIRQALGDAYRHQASLDICALIEAWPVFHRAQVILTYMPIKAEVDLRPLLERRPEKDWLLPRILPEEDHAMLFHPYDPQRLERHPFGMDEPAPDLPVIPAQKIELALVPGLAYDRNGWRLGYGGGYYDRFLRNMDGISLGVAYRDLILEALPRDEFDVPVDFLVSERGLLRIGE